jgi:hypothetical protein
MECIECTDAAQNPDRPIFGLRVIFEFRETTFREVARETIRKTAREIAGEAIRKTARETIWRSRCDRRCGS